MAKLFLYFTIIGVFACNSSSFGVKEVSPGSADASPGNIDPGKIRFSFGLRDFRAINATMHNKAGPVQNSQASEGHGHDNTENNKSLAAAAATTCKQQGRWHGHNESYTSVGVGKVGEVWCGGVKDLLPKGSDPLGLTGPTQVGIFKLASAYCQQLMADNNAIKQKLPTVAEQLKTLQMSTRPADISSSLQTAVAAALIDNFHGEGLSIRPDAATIKSDLAKLMADLISTQEEKWQKQASNQEVLVGACSAALASAQTMFH